MICFNCMQSIIAHPEAHTLNIDFLGKNKYLDIKQYLICRKKKFRFKKLFQCSTRKFLKVLRVFMSGRYLSYFLYVKETSLTIAEKALAVLLKEKKEKKTDFISSI